MDLFSGNEGRKTAVDYFERGSFLDETKVAFTNQLSIPSLAVLYA